MADDILISPILKFGQRGHSAYEKLSTVVTFCFQVLTVYTFCVKICPFTILPAQYFLYLRRPNFTKLKINTIMAKKVSVTPLHDRVIVKADAAEEKTSGGIIIPDTAKEKPQRGIVIAAGPGKKDEPVTVKPGNTVLYGKYAGTEIQIDGEDYLIMRESDILAIV
jgi:chaperonin GroES